MTFWDLICFSFAILTASLIGYLISDLLCPIEYPRWLVGAFAAPTGLGICSLIVFLFRRPMFTIEIVFLVVLLALWFRARRTSLSWRALSSWRFPALGVVFAVAVGWAAGASATFIERLPNGGMDGWAIWDSHARYMISGGSAWRQGLEYTFHPDYPLLLPGVIAHIWRYMGSNLPDVAGFVGLLFELSGIAVLVATLARLRGLTVALIMAFVMIGTPRYVLHAVSQYADVPLSVYILSTVALVCLYEKETSKPFGLMVLAGFMAGCAAWTKNEGLPFVLVTTGTLLAPMFWKPSITRRRIAGFAAGLLLPIAVIAYFKMTAPPNDLMSSRNYVELLAKVSNSDRYLIIFGNFFRTGWVFGGWALNPFLPILVFLGLSGTDRSVFHSFGWRAGVAILGMLLASYFAIYVITPLELQDHLDSSLPRLLMHVWPACLLLSGMTVRNPDSSEIQNDLTAQARAV